MHRLLLLLFLVPRLVLGQGATVPFTTYEAEAPINRTNGTVVTLKSSPTTPQDTPELEASGRGYVALTAPGQYLEFPGVLPSNTIVLRHCIPDSPHGGSTSATLSLYVNGVFRQSLLLTSTFNWLYGPISGNGQSNDPAAGPPHVFWDESRFFISGPAIRKGDVIRLQKDPADTAAFYRIDLIELEHVSSPLPPPPIGTYLSVADFGAKDKTDSTKAIQSCIDAAKARHKTVWIPPGEYYQSATFNVDGVTIQGAGMWYTTISSTLLGTDWLGKVGFHLTGTGPSVSDLFVQSLVHNHRSDGGQAFTGNPAGWSVRNVWITHTNTGFWMSGASKGIISHCRVRFTYADGINLNMGATDNTVEQNHLRGIGDDGLAILSDATAPPTTGNTLRFNTVIANWWGSACDLAGGSRHIIRNNYFADTLFSGAFAINLTSAYPMRPLTSAIFFGNTIVRGGGCGFGGQQRGAIWIYPDRLSISGMTIENNLIIHPLFSGIDLEGSGNQTITFAENVIDTPGTEAVSIAPQATGTGAFTRNTAKNVSPTSHPFVNHAAPHYIVTGTSNTWNRSQ